MIIKPYFYTGIFWGLIEGIKTFLLYRQNFSSLFEIGCLLYQALLIYVFFFIIMGVFLQVIFKKSRLKKEIPYILMGTGLFIFLFHLNNLLFILNIPLFSIKRLTITFFILFLALTLTLAAKKLSSRKWVKISGNYSKKILWSFLSLSLAFNIFFFVRLHYSIGIGDALRDNGYNVLFITIDTLRSDYLGCYGHDYIKTPHIDKMAGEGVIFKECITQSSITNPAHTSIFTSSFVSNHGVRDNGGYKLNDEFTTLAEVLREKGFLTAAFISGWPLKAYVSGLNQGFFYYDHKFLPNTVLNDHVMKLGLPYLSYRTLLHLNKDLYLNLNERQGKWINKSFLSWLSRNKNKKWFVWLHYFDPHTSYMAPEPFRRMYDPEYRGPATGSMFKLWQYNNGKITYDDKDIKHLEALYAGEVSYVDHNLGRVFNYLKQTGLYDRTIIILTADHGESLGEHNYFGHALYVYEGMIKVPLIFKGNFLSRRVEDTVRHIDIMPTLLDLLNISIPENLKGRSLKPYLYGKNIEPLTETFSECYRSGQFRRTIRTKNYKLIENIGRGYEFYNLEDDPEELNNIFSEKAKIAEGMKERLAKFTKENVLPQDKKTRLNRDAVESLKSLGYLQ